MAKTGTSFVEERRTIKAPIDVVHTVLTSPADMVGWLANEARCEARTGALYELRWNSGYAVQGKVLAADGPQRLTVAWRGSGEPGETKVAFSLAARGADTEVVVRHSGFGRSAAWATALAESRKGWPQSLENLAYLTETGIDLREARRPLMGVNLGEPLNAERSAKLGLSVDSGVYLEGVIDGLSAQAAGLQAHDVITTVNGQPVVDYLGLLAFMQTRSAGESLEVVYVRGKQHKTVTLELKPKPVTPLPTDHNLMLATLLECYEKARMDVVKAVTGASEGQAGRKPDVDEWSAKEVIAHLCVVERDLQDWIAEAILGIEPHQYSGNPTALPEMLGAVLAAAPSLAGLLNRLHQDQADTLAIVAALRPEVIANRARHRRIGAQVWGMAEHITEHIPQIRAALAAR